MLPYYRTVSGYGEKELTIKRSRFIGYARPVHTEEEAISFIEEMKQKHRTANHNCSAYVVGERDQWQKSSDDGEPSGTAGKPILEVIKHQQLKNVAVVVTRYFGGIMLGAGGLVRAYTEGAALGLEAAVPIYKVWHREVQLTIDYTWHGKLENELQQLQMRRGETTFSDKVTLLCYPIDIEAESFMERMKDLTQGQADIVEKGKIFLDHNALPLLLKKLI